MELPHRVCNRGEARRRFGDRLDRLAPWFWRADPLADAAIAELAQDPRGWRVLDVALKEGVAACPRMAPAMRRLLEQVEHVPFWVDWDRIDRAGRLFYRAGVLGNIVLGARSLVAGYCSPAGNKPLVLTGALKSTDIGRRLAETGRFVTATCEPGGLRREAEGFRITVRVRLMHARVRWLIARSDRWRGAEWGLPINQHDMMATSLLFSIVFVDGLRELGMRVTRRECEDYLHLWRYSSYLMGVEPELLPCHEAEAVEIAELVRLTQGPPDADARALTRALLDSPDLKRNAGSIGLAESYLRMLLGEEWADALGLARSPWRHAVRLSRRVIGPVDAARARLGLDPLFEAVGRKYWTEVIEQAAEGTPFEYRPTQRLAGG